MNICFVSAGYPTKDDPVYAFIRPVVAAIADMGNDCTVVSPQSVCHDLKKKMRPTKWEDKTEKGHIIQIYQPKILSFSTLRINGQSISTILWSRAVKKIITGLGPPPDLLYGHFWGSAIAAAIACNGKIPVIAVSGESKIRVKDQFDDKTIAKYLPLIKGCIFVSTKNKEESEEMGLMKYEPASVILPNGYDPNVFYSMNYQKARERLGIDANSVIAVFVGAFSDRKGVNRVIEAARFIPNLKLILIGSGANIPKNEQVIFCGKVTHNEIVKYLNAADFFVLPTKAEGCCNAIIEALACGLPVISSNLPFNWDVLNKENSILVNPESVEEIHNAMERLCVNSLERKKLKAGALETAQSLDIVSRSKNIMTFLDSIVENEGTK